MNFILSPDPQILTEEAFALSAHCVQSTDDIVMTLSAPSFDSGAIKIRSVLGEEWSPLAKNGWMEEGERREKI